MVRLQPQYIEKLWKVSLLRSSLHIKFAIILAIFLFLLAGPLSAQPPRAPSAIGDREYQRQRDLERQRREQR